MGKMKNIDSRVDKLLSSKKDFRQVKTKKSSKIAVIGIGLIVLLGITGIGATISYFVETTVEANVEALILYNDNIHQMDLAEDLDVPLDFECAGYYLFNHSFSLTCSALAPNNVEIDFVLTGAEDGVSFQILNDYYAPVSTVTLEPGETYDFFLNVETSSLIKSGSYSLVLTIIPTPL